MKIPKSMFWVLLAVFVSLSAYIYHTDWQRQHVSNEKQYEWNARIEEKIHNLDLKLAGNK